MTYVSKKRLLQRAVSALLTGRGGGKKWRDKKKRQWNRSQAILVNRTNTAMLNLTQEKNPPTKVCGESLQCKHKLFVVQRMRSWCDGS